MVRAVHTRTSKRLEINVEGRTSFLTFVFIFKKNCLSIYVLLLTISLIKFRSFCFSLNINFPQDIDLPGPNVVDKIVTISKRKNNSVDTGNLPDFEDGDVVFTNLLNKKAVIKNPESDFKKVIGENEVGLQETKEITSKKARILGLNTFLMCGCHYSLIKNGFRCRRCFAIVCELPTACPVCQITLADECLISRVRYGQ